DTTSTRWVTASGHELKEIGKASIEVRIKNYKVKHTFTVIQELSTNLILGTDFLTVHGANIDYTRQKLIINEQETDLITSQKQVYASLRAKNDIFLEPYEEHIEWIRVPKGFDDAILLNSEHKKHSFFVKNGVYKPLNSRIPLLIQNKFNKKYIIKKGCLLVNIEQVDNVKIFEENKCNVNNNLDLDGLNYGKLDD
ncbi:unnamed protein product, partial [Brachionus calyciflorus]